MYPQVKSSKKEIDLAINTTIDTAIKDIINLFNISAKLLGKFGVQPGSFYGGTVLGICAGNMAAVYGFDAREVLTAVSDIEKKVTNSDE